ncbi:MAG: hypothetical protein HY646_08770, partial [Acidobacteria bacterium]|nr:hypothetical protein [Acidobacteriota bacterium]
MLRALLVILLFAIPLHAEVVRIEVTSRADIAGKEFGKAGIYERLSGKIYFAVDPQNTANRIITDIDKAPRNAAGKVEFSSDFYMLKPKDAKLGNGTLLFEVSNRGGRGMIGFFNRNARGNDPQTADQLGDGFLMEQGFTLLWVGWQFDVPDGGNRLRVYVPVAREADGRPIQGLVRSELPNPGASLPLSDRNHIPYRVADPNDPANILTVRDCPECPRRIVRRNEWRFREEGNSVFILTPQPRKIYEIVYKSLDPPVVGLGPTAVRDAVSKLKHGSSTELSIP